MGPSLAGPVVHVAYLHAWRLAICCSEGVNKSFGDLVCPQFIGSNLGDLKEKKNGTKKSKLWL